MALLKGKLDSIPKDAIVLDEPEAVEYQLKFLRKWKDQSDLWALNYGGTILASLSALTGIYINSYFRMRLKLLHYGQIASYLPICVLPPIMSFGFHSTLVVPDVVLQKNCAICTEMRSSALQAFSGVVFPFALAPMATLALAVRFNTYQIPYITKEPLMFYYLLRKFVKPIGRTLVYIFLGHAVAASTITYFEAKNVNRVNDKLMLLNYEYDLS